MRVPISLAYLIATVMMVLVTVMNEEDLKEIKIGGIAEFEISG